MSEGWIKTYRKICDNPIWFEEPFTPAQAWMDLLINANYSDKYFMVRGNRVDVKRGQIGWSEVTMSERWKWSRTRVRNFLKRLEKEQQIKQQKNTVTSIISIVNYELYQEKEQQKEQQTGQQKNSRLDSRLDTTKEYKEREEGKEKDISVFDLALKDFEEMRKKIKKPLTDRAKLMVLKKLDEIADNEEEKIAILEKSILNCWQGIFPLDKQEKKQVPKEPEVDEVIQMARQAEERRRQIAERRSGKGDTGGMFNQ